MFINLLLVSKECLSGQQPLERAVYLPTTKNSLSESLSLPFSSCPLYFRNRQKGSLILRAE